MKVCDVVVTPPPSSRGSSPESVPQLNTQKKTAENGELYGAFASGALRIRELKTDIEHAPPDAFVSQDAALKQLESIHRFLVSSVPKRLGSASTFLSSSSKTERTPVVNNEVLQTLGRLQNWDSSSLLPPVAWASPCHCPSYFFNRSDTRAQLKPPTIHRFLAGENKLPLLGPSSPYGGSEASTAPSPESCTRDQTPGVQSAGLSTLIRDPSCCDVRAPPPNTTSGPAKEDRKRFAFLTWTLDEVAASKDTADSDSQEGSVSRSSFSSRVQRRHTVADIRRLRGVHRKNNRRLGSSLLSYRSCPNLEYADPGRRNDVGLSSKFVPLNLDKKHDTPENPVQNGLWNTIAISPRGTYLHADLLRRRQSFVGSSKTSSIPAFVTFRLSDLQTPKSRQHLFHYLSEIQKNCGRSRRPPRTSNLVLMTAGYDIAKPGKIYGGEDSYFFRTVKGTSVLGVADGVGEWIDFGVNPRLFSDNLLRGAKTHAAAVLAPGAREIINARMCALDCIEAGYESAVKSIRGLGAATITLGVMDSKGQSLGIANLGDSGVFVLRRDPRHNMLMTMVRRTKEQQHFFNCPFQLSHIPPLETLPDLEEKGYSSLVSVLRRLHNERMFPEADLPSMADLYEVDVKEGDLVIFGTDGLFDNLFDTELASLVSHCISPYESRFLIDYSEERGDRLTKAWLQGDLSHPCGIEPPTTRAEDGDTLPYTRPETIARGIAEAALARSVDSGAHTPFGRNAKRNGHPEFSIGGKMDDITVIAAWVVHPDDLSNNGIIEDTRIKIHPTSA